MKELLIQTHSCKAEDVPVLGNRYLTGNGYMGVRGTLEEYGKEHLAAINLAGIYDRFADQWREPLNAPNPFALRLYHENEPLALPQAKHRKHTQILDVRRGLHRRMTVFGNGTELCVERFAHMAEVHLLCLRATVTAAQAGAYRLDSILDGDVWDIHGPHYRKITFQNLNGLISARAYTNEGDQVAVCVQSQLNASHQRSYREEARKYLSSDSFTLDAGETATLELIAAVYTTKDTVAPLAAAIKAVQSAQSYDCLRQTHIDCWNDLWKTANIEIDGDDEAEEALNYSAYHLLSIAPRHAQRLSVPARGLSGQTYKGAIFWDTEMFMLDFYLAVLPDVAKTLLRYRIDTLDGARDKARQYGCRGAFYAWESQEGGFDACSDYNVTDVFTGRPMRTYFRDKQVHITAAVVYGLWKYARWTGDDSLWLEGGAEVLIEAARFYHSLLVKRVESDTLELWDVIGPDEYHERVNNNAYTNEMARFVWMQTCELCARLKKEHPLQLTALEGKLNFMDELPAFQAAAAHLKHPNKRADKVIEQFDGYFALEDATVDEVRARLKDPREYWGGAYGVASQTQVIKQADVITLLYMLRDQYGSETLRANYAYYLPRTEHGSSLSACMYALAACGIGKPEEGYSLFLKSAKADLVDGGKQWAGLVYIGGTHPAAAGGAYMALLWGFMGLRLQDGELAQTPCLPQQWRGVRMSLRYRGRTIKLEA